MGRFFTSTQIYNPKQLDRKAFAVSFCKKMKKEGYELCEADCAELSYVLAFADHSNWVTISLEAYEQGNQTSQADTARIARMLGTYCVSTIVIDSDCAMLDLYDDKGKKADTAVMGRTDDYFGDAIPAPAKAVWEQFLSAGSTWEQLTAVMQGSYVFVEDGLTELAPMIGMDSRRILFAFENVNENDANVQFLSFKKADSKQEKKLTLNSTFVKVFGDGLAPLGFVRLKKTKLPFFVRLINGELLQIVTYREKAKRKDGYKTFEVLGGIVSLYRRTIDFTKSPELWLKSNHYYYSKWDAELNNDVKKQAIKMGYSMSENQTIPVEACEEAFKKSIISFVCKTDDNVSLLNGMKNAFDVTAHIMIPIFDQVNTYNSCIDFLYKYYSGWLELAELDEFIENDRYSVSEGLLLILANYRDDGIERTKKELSERIPFLGKKEDAEKLKLHYENKRAEQIAIRNMMLDDPQLNVKVMEELERRKAENIAVLKLHGIG